MRKFKASKKTFGDLDAATVSHLITASSDLALILDKKGVIRDLALDNDDYLQYGCNDWIGRSWSDVVTVESRQKVEEMLEGAQSEGAARWRQVNHPAKSGQDLPIRYSAIKLNPEGRVLAIGRDLRPISMLQQRLVSAQVQMEHEYARLRLAETRYQTLFQLSAEPVIILDTANHKIVEANPAATDMLKGDASHLTGRSFFDLLDPAGVQAAQKLFAHLRVAPRADDVAITFAGSGQEFSLSASIFRHEMATHYLLRLSPINGTGVVVRGEQRQNGALFDVISKMPDGFVVIDDHRQILTANSAFLELVQLAGEDQARGERIERWLGRVEVDVDVLIANLREYGFLRRFQTMIRGEYGGRADIEVAGVAVTGSHPPCYGLTIRKAQPALSFISPPRQAVPRSLEQLKELVGRVPLRDLVRETTDIIEQMCIEAALELTSDNRASAAEMLGLSRQSFYVKLRRHGLGELDSQETT